jgi:hypothetical protein
LILVHVAEIAGVDPLKATVANLAVDGEGLLEMRPRFLQSPLYSVKDTEMADEIAFEAAITNLARHCERSLKVRPRIDHPPLIAPQVAQSAENACFATSVAACARNPQCLFESTRRLLGATRSA